VASKRRPRSAAMGIPLLWCNGCQCFYPLWEFYCRRYCAKCSARNGKKYWAKRPERTNDLAAWVDSVVRGMRSRHKIKWKERAIVTKEELKEIYEQQGGACAITGQQFVLEKRHPCAPSVDQRQPGLGYSPDNVQWVCAWANYAKNMWPQETIEQLLVQAGRHVKEKRECNPYRMGGGASQLRGVLVARKRPPETHGDSPPPAGGRKET
jgi:hypothetical protein